MTRRGRGEVLRERTPLTLRPDGDGPEAVVAWDQLDRAEQAALMRLNRGRSLAIDRVTVARLLCLGLATRLPSGWGISRKGRELAISALLSSGTVTGPPA
jgi:hypothetical protein